MLLLWATVRHLLASTSPSSVRHLLASSVGHLASAVRHLLLLLRVAHLLTGSGGVGLSTGTVGGHAC